MAAARAFMTGVELVGENAVMGIVRQADLARNLHEDTVQPLVASLAG